MRVYGFEPKLKAFATQYSLPYYPVYERYSSWRIIFDGKLRGLYEHGLDVAMAREKEHLGENERKSAKIVGSVTMMGAIALYFGMFWYFPLHWKISMLFYGFGSGLMFMALSVYFEDYKWESKLVDLFTKPFLKWL